MKKVVIIGLDGLNPDLVYDWKDELPTIRKLMNRGIHGRIKSTVPPTTAAAWTSLMSGKNPGQFGFWGSTYRDDYSYGEPRLVNSQRIRTDTLYDILPRYGKKVAIINVPVTYPPLNIPDGFCVSSVALDVKGGLTYPAELKEEITKVVGEYLTDACEVEADFAQMDKDKVLERIYKMDQQRFDLLGHFIQNKNCDFVCCVITGTDRVPRLFYGYLDKSYMKYTHDSKYEDAIKNHYKFCDHNIGRIVELVDKETVIIVTSGYRAQRLDGAINLSEWLIREGYMNLNSRPKQPVPLSRADVNWANTKAWTVGCTGQIYLNLEGREPQGIVPPEGYDDLLDEIGEKLRGISDQKGKRFDTMIYKRKDIHFGEYANLGPDLFVYFNSCLWNSSELIGYDSIYSYQAPEEPDDTGQGPYGFFAMAGSTTPNSGEFSEADLLDIAPTVLQLMETSIPPDMEGKVLVEKKERVYPEEKEEEIRRRLQGLGYFR